MTNNFWKNFITGGLIIVYDQGGHAEDLLRDILTHHANPPDKDPRTIDIDAHDV
jgi:hypothetical protein